MSMNFVYISPNFPSNFVHFCKALKQQGVNVLGIGDEPYELLDEKIIEHCSEYYRVTDLSNYDEMYKAVAFYAFKYGKIDFLESNNEHWLIQDARLREDFNIVSSARGEQIYSMRLKSEMKKIFKENNIPSAAYCLIQSHEQALQFAKEVSYPIIIKPNDGVGATNTEKIYDEEGLKQYLHKVKIIDGYIMEQFIDGTIVSFDGISDKNRDIVYATTHYYPTNILQSVNNQESITFYSLQETPTNIQSLGEKIVKAFHSQQRFFHIELFVLNKDYPKLGRQGDIIALEVNMRPPGGNILDMMNYAANINVYEIWANTILGNTNMISKNANYICVFTSRRKQITYQHSIEDVLLTYNESILNIEYFPEVIAKAMGELSILARFSTQEEADAFAKYVIT